jgi:hypothetical protein
LENVFAKNLKLTDWSLLHRWVVCTQPMNEWWLGLTQIVVLQVASWVLTCIEHEKKLSFFFQYDTHFTKVWTNFFLM